MTNRYTPTVVIEEGDEYGEDTLTLEIEIGAGILIKIDLPSTVEVYDVEDKHSYYTRKPLKEAREILWVRELDKGEQK